MQGLTCKRSLSVSRVNRHRALICAKRVSALQKVVAQVDRMFVANDFKGGSLYFGIWNIMAILLAAGQFPLFKTLPPVRRRRG